MKKADILILGAGCAGTSLAHYLDDYGYAEKVVLLDNRTTFDRDQRWCSWAKLPESLTPLVQKSWREWKVCDETRSTVQTSENFSYQQIYAPQFFAHFHSRWHSLETPIEISLGEKVERIEESWGFVEVTTNRDVWRANLVFDARHQGSANLTNVKKKSGIYLHQTFFGWTIEFPRPVFNEKSATLMDFRTAQTDGANFIYVLPYSDRKALVESTSFSPNSTDWDNHLQAVKTYVAKNFGDDYEIKAEESGELPMTTAKIPAKSGEKIFNLGVAGGSVRPSSGYAFHRIQRQTSAIARAIREKDKIPEIVAPGKYNFFDAVFLEAIARQPNSAKESFLRMFEQVSPDSLIRFLTDESSYSDDLAVISALPKKSFSAASLQSLWRMITAGSERNEKIRLSQGTLHNSLDKSARRLVARQFER